MPENETDIHEIAEELGVTVSELPRGWLTADEMDRELTRRGYTKVQHKTPQEALDALNEYGRSMIGDRWKDMSYAAEAEQ